MTAFKKCWLNSWYFFHKILLFVSNKVICLQAAALTSALGETGDNNWLATIPPPVEYARIVSQETIPKEDSVDRLERSLESRLGLPRGHQIRPASAKYKANEIIYIWTFALVNTVGYTVQ